jgi:hypothetical protein
MKYAEFIISILYSKIMIIWYELHLLPQSGTLFLLYIKYVLGMKCLSSFLALDSLTGWVMWPCCVVKSSIIIKILRYCLVLQSQLASVPDLHAQLFLEPTPSDHPYNITATSHPLPIQGAVVHLRWMISDHYLKVGDDTVFGHTCNNTVKTTDNRNLETVFIYTY